MYNKTGSTSLLTQSFSVNTKLKNMKCDIKELQTKLYCTVQTADRQRDRQKCFSNTALKQHYMRTKILHSDGIDKTGKSSIQIVINN